MAVATAEELRRFLRRSTAFTAEETAQAELFLSLAQGEIEEEAGQTLDSATDTITLDGPARDEREHHVGTGTRKLILPRWPVTDVASVTLLEDDEILSEGHDADFTWSQAGIVTRIGAWWPSGDQVIEVVYTAGFVTWPTSLKAMGLRLAAGAWDNPSRLQAEKLGDHSRSWTAEALGMELSDKDRRTIGAYRARTTW
ncbi:hypothetical protein OHR68_43210 [Spirillospora sp. NBC_00431]